MGGDFNLPDINWENSEIVGRTYPIDINQAFLDTFNDAGLRQIVKEPTRGNNILDLFLTNCPDLINSNSTVAGLGDHAAVRIESTLQLPRKKPTPPYH